MSVSSKVTAVGEIDKIVNTVAATISSDDDDLQCTQKLPELSDTVYQIWNAARR